jgi:hypothetical protein
MNKASQHNTTTVINTAKAMPNKVMSKRVIKAMLGC